MSVLEICLEFFMEKNTVELTGCMLCCLDVRQVFTLSVLHPCRLTHRRFFGLKRIFTLRGMISKAFCSAALSPCVFLMLSLETLGGVLFGKTLFL